MKISLISTVKNCAASVDEFLASLAEQTRRPDEVIIVDGGSSDGTAELFERDESVTLIREPGANISRGRNIALAAASHDLIAVTDADCVLEPGWFQAIAAPLEAGADVSMGFYAPLVDGFFQSCMAAVNLPAGSEEIDPARFMPSARSVAYRREAIDMAGGYPEWLAIGEDMWVNHRWRELGLDLRFAPDAVVHWRLRSGLRETWTQYFRYARGDADAGMYPERHALRYGTYAGAALALRSRRTLPKLAALVGAAAYARAPIHRAWTRFDGDPRARAGATVTVPLLMMWIDTAKMAGYAAGLVERTQR
jgi:glycosyltransferase involved in cell wall biosynthesis